jgi:hypothetical protein
MACFYPLDGWLARRANPSGKRSIVFDKSAGFIDRPMSVPCGQCIGCRLERSRQWAVRCMHEASEHQDSCFVTLTYSDENMPHGGSLTHRHFQKFMKRLRKKTPGRMRFFMCGEYGPLLDRPHYHALLFGRSFYDQVKTGISESGEDVFMSPELASIWKLGICTVQAVTFKSAAYVSRYACKKVTGEQAEEHYKRVDATGQEYQVEPEYARMSNRPGIGARWYERFGNEVFPQDFVVMEGRKVRPPSYYFKLLERDSEAKALLVKHARVKAAANYAENNTIDRLRVREKVTLARTSQLKRT